ncbi:unnamed protein product [Ranitomeya imitator]|uniref:NTF2 domain-containing protein n=1 Tax=Ranitomeya imitator TaxID=111125 RepID=A0ABN9LHE3_9NEOB|nr:unnamed protein product [Ranitomeya imitator]
MSGHMVPLITVMNMRLPWLVRALCLNVSAEDAKDETAPERSQVNIESGGGLSDGEVSVVETFRMDDKRIWEHIGCSFVQHYYNLFDTDRAQLKAIYGLSFLRSIFQAVQPSIWKPQRLPWQLRSFRPFSSFRGIRFLFATAEATGTLREEVFLPEDKISLLRREVRLLQCSRLPSFPMCHEGPGETDTSCLTWEGQQYQGKDAIIEKLSADDDQVLGFQQIFILKCISGAWVCTNEVFRLALHNI